MNKLFTAIMLLCISDHLYAQLPIRKINRTAVRSTAMQFQFASNLKGVKLVAGGSDKTTTSDGVTRTVLPLDGSTQGVSQQLGASQNTQDAATVCQSQTVTLSAGFSELNLLDPGGIEFWPGRLIHISSIDDGSYTSFAGFESRNPLSIALIGSGAATNNVTRSIPSTGSGITQGTVTNAINTIKNNFGSNDFGSVGWDFDLVEFSSTNQFMLEVGAGVQIAPVNLETRARAGFDTRQFKNKIVLRFVREAFTVKVDSPLDQLVNAATLSDDAGVISSVKFGQFGIVEIESDSSLVAMQAALDFKFNVDPTVAVTGDVATRLENTANSFSIKAIFRGISGNENIPSAPTINDLKRILSGGRPFTATTPVVPIAFTVNSIKTGQMMMLKSRMSYVKRECTVVPASENFRLVIQPIAITSPRINDGLSDDEDVFGKIRIRIEKTPGTGNFNEVWSKAMDRNVKVKQSVSPSADGAYSLVGDAQNYSFHAQAAGVDMNDKLAINIRLSDEEFIGGPYPYGEKTLMIPVSDLIRSLSADGTTSIDNFDNTNKAFFIDVVENNNTNKLRVWFKVKKEVL
jgi:hypothetical protein